jgi:hypothetical protein
MVGEKQYPVTRRIKYKQRWESAEDERWSRVTVVSVSHTSNDERVEGEDKRWGRVTYREWGRKTVGIIRFRIIAASNTSNNERVTVEGEDSDEVRKSKDSPFQQ